MKSSRLFLSTFALLAAWVLCLPPGLRADESRINFDRDIRPILSNNCFKCHGPDEKQRKAHLRLDRRDSALAELKSGDRAIVPGKKEESALVARVTATESEERMPPPASGKILTPEQIELLSTWVAEGAEYRDHWSFVPLRRPAPPDVKQGTFVQNPIDLFVLARLEREGLRPSAPADKVTLIRRVTSDLTGLPPTLAEVDVFVADDSPRAYERLVDRLLASPQYGEHMARYWLDAVRYGDTHGLHFDNERSLWPYRDWVINALNRNLPFDRFAIEQVAGDLLPQPTRDQQVATGFNRCNVTSNEGGSIDEELLMRYAVDRTEAVSTVFLGLTLGCAVCHDHKFDPVTQKEFYQLYAFFNSAADKAMDGNALAPPPILKLATPQQETKLKVLDGQIHAVGREITEHLGHIEYAEPPTATKIAEPREYVWIIANGWTWTQFASTAYWDKPGIVRHMRRNGQFDCLTAWEAFERTRKSKNLPKSIQDALKVDPAKRNAEQTKVVRDYFLENVYVKTRPLFEPLHKRMEKLNKERTALDTAIPAAMVMADLPQPRESFVLVRGAYNKKGERVYPGTPAVLPAMPKDAPKNRLGLARWLVEPSQPLTARVTVNRFWEHYFGRGIVKTANDFGYQGEWPTHPELLDWLATEFMDSGWDMKHVHKLIVMSGTYRQLSQVTPELLQRDPENALLARGPRFRMDAEMVRDAALSASGLLVQKLGGPSVKPYQPSGLWETVGFLGSNTRVYKRDSGDALYRRSMYTFWKRTSPPPGLTMFDAPSRETCTVRRPRTNTPLQALTLMNDEQYVEASRHLARRMMIEGGETPQERLTYGFRLTTARRPDAKELEALTKLFEQQLAFYGADKDAALKLLGVGASKRNDTLDPGEHAAWTMMANLLLNLDETITKE